MNAAGATDAIVQEIVIHAGAERVFGALTEPAQRVGFDLTEKNGATTVRLTHSGLTTEKARGSHKGWPQILEWLRSYCEK